MMLRRLCAVAGLGVAILAGATMAFAGGVGRAARTSKAKLGFDVANMDTTCKPCDDFYKYVNGGWMKKNPIPAQYPAWGPDQIMFERTEARLHEILEAAAANTVGRGGFERAEGRRLLRELHGHEGDRREGAETARRSICRGSRRCMTARRCWKPRRDCRRRAPACCLRTARIRILPTARR